eukprot:1161646-Pelagomonas_calceolata.AAC.14
MPFALLSLVMHSKRNVRICTAAAGLNILGSIAPGHLLGGFPAHHLPTLSSLPPKENTACHLLGITFFQGIICEQHLQAALKNGMRLVGWDVLHVPAAKKIPPYACMHRLRSSQITIAARMEGLELSCKTVAT